MKRTIAFWIASLLILFHMTACNDKADKTETIPETDLSAETETVPETRLQANVPDETMGGRTFYIMCDAGIIGQFDFIAEEETGELLNDAVYQRNLIIEDRFEVELETILHGYGSDFVTNLNTLITADDSTCDVAMGMNNMSTGITGLVYNGSFVDWNLLEYVDLSMPWWDQNVLRDLCFGDKVFTMTGDMHPSTLGNTRVLLFNKNMFTDMGYEYPYSLVLDHKWTYEVFASMLKDSMVDLNGDGEISYKDDQVGFTGWQWDLGESLYVGMGGTYIMKDTDGRPVLNMNNERSLKVMDNIVALFQDGAGAWQNNVDWGHDITLFNTGRSLFLNSRLYLLNEFREMEDDFGILPHPLLDENQENYSQSVDPVCTMAYIPVTNRDLRSTSILLEAISAESYHTVMPNYYEVILQTKYVRDAESEEMIDIIKNNRYFPLQINTFNYVTFADLINSKTNNFTTSYAAKEKAASAELAAVIEAYMGE